jgi:YD repeat-containing protein
VTVPTDADFTANFSTTSGLNLVDSWGYDLPRRPTFHEGPQFNAFDGSSIVATKIKRQWHYTKLSTGEPVTIEYPHLDSSYFHVALSLTVRDLEGHVLTSALGELNASYRDTDLDNDFDEGQSTLEAGFRGSIVRRTDLTYQGDKLSKEEVWSDADNGGAAKFTTTHSYDTAGRKEKIVNPVGTITRMTYDALNRMKTRNIGTDDGSPGNMTKVEERFYDDEETGDTDDPNSRGLLTQVKLFTNVGGDVRETNLKYDYRGRLTERKEPEDVKVTFAYTNRNEVTDVKTLKDSSATLFARTESRYDSWGRVYEARAWGVPGGGGTESGYASVWTWRNGRGLVVKTRSRGKVFEKTGYDDAGRVSWRAVSYHTTETAYADADDLTGDTVIQETRYALDPAGVVELAGVYERRHNGSGTGPLSVGTSGNSRPQYRASWYDKLHRMVHAANYGTNGGTDMAARPSGTPPASSSSTSLVVKQSYTTKSEPLDATDTMGIVSRSVYDDPGRLTARIDRYVNGDPGPATDEDRRVEYTYNAAGQVLKTTAKLANWDGSDWYDRVTENVYGMTLTENPALASNDLLRLVKYPDPDSATPGQPSEDANDQEAFAYNAQGEVIWRKNAMQTEHSLDYDLRGRLIQDITPMQSGIAEISRTYDTLDRPILVTSKNYGGGVANQVKYEYDRFSTVSKIWQDWNSEVDGTSPKVQCSYTFPTSGDVAVRKTSTTYPSGAVTINEVYNSGADDILSRVTQRKQGSTVFFHDSYLGLGRLVERHFGSLYLYWTLVGTDSANQDNYWGLDRFGRIDNLKIHDPVIQLKTYNQYAYTYNHRSQVTLREDFVGNVSGSYEFDETFEYDNLGRLTDHKRGVYSGGSMTTIRLHECWTYDRSGNVTAYYTGTGSGCTPSTATQTFNASNEITSRNSFTNYAQWNDLGSLTRKGFATDSFTWDVWNRMTQAENYGVSTLASYEYNGLGQVISRTNSNSQQPDIYYYYGENGQVLEELHISGGIHRWYVWGSQGDGDLVARGPVVQYSALDARGNVVTRFDSLGAPIARYVYDGYGKPSQLTGTWSWQVISEDLYLFAGLRFHKDHGQYLDASRPYDPDLWSYALRTIAMSAYAFLGNDPQNNEAVKEKKLIYKPLVPPPDRQICCGEKFGDRITSRQTVNCPGNREAAQCCRDASAWGQNLVYLSDGRCSNTSVAEAKPEEPPPPPEDPEPESPKPATVAAPPNRVCCQCIVECYKQWLFFTSSRQEHVIFWEISCPATSSADSCCAGSNPGGGYKTSCTGIPTGTASPCSDIDTFDGFLRKGTAADRDAQNPCGLGKLERLLSPGPGLGQATRWTEPRGLGPSPEPVPTGGN